MKWEKVKLGDCCFNIQTGPFGSQLHQTDYSEDGIPVIMPKDMDNGRISLRSIAKVSTEHVERLARHKVKRGDILFSRRGDVGRSALIGKREENWLCGTGCLKASVNSALADSRFVFYQLNTSTSLEWFEKHAIGSTMLNLNTQILNDVPVSLPPLPIQKHIASILSAYDDLIENNQKQIKLLEEAAQRLYKEWFVDLRFPGHEGVKIVDGVPEGWRKEKLVELAELKAGGDKPKIFSKMKSNICKVPIFSNGLENEGLFGYTDKADIGQESITISARGNVGYTCLRRVPYLAIVRLICVIPRKKDISTYLYFYLKHTNYNSNGSAQQQLTIPMIKNTVVCVPDENALSNFDDKVRRYFDLVDVLKYQISSLREARDRLLPKLMSGEVEV